MVLQVKEDRRRDREQTEKSAAIQKKLQEKASTLPADQIVQNAFRQLVQRDKDIDAGKQFRDDQFEIDHEAMHPEYKRTGQVTARVRSKKFAQEEVRQRKAFLEKASGGLAPGPHKGKGKGKETPKGRPKGGPRTPKGYPKGKGKGPKGKARTLKGYPKGKSKTGPKGKGKGKRGKGYGALKGKSKGKGFGTKAYSPKGKGKSMGKKGKGPKVMRK